LGGPRLIAGGPWVKFELRTIKFKEADLKKKKLKKGKKEVEAEEDEDENEETGEDSEEDEGPDEDAQEEEEEEEEKPKKKKLAERKDKEEEEEDESEEEGEETEEDSGEEEENGEEENGEEEEEEQEKPKKKKTLAEEAEEESEEEDRPKKKKKSHEEEEDSEEEEENEETESEEEEEEEEKPKKKKPGAEEEEEGEAEEEGEEEEEVELVQVQIDVDKYKPKPPSKPIPAGVEDCFGKYNDPEVGECQRCFEKKNCRAVMNARAQREGELVSKGETMKKKVKKAESEEKPVKLVFHKKSKLLLRVSPTVREILEASKYGDRGGVLKAGRKVAFILMGGDKVIKIANSDQDKGFRVELHSRLGPKAFGLNGSNWTKKGWLRWIYSGKQPVRLGKSLRILFKNWEKATAEE